MPLSEFNRWFSRYKSAWEKLDPRSATALFTQAARYFETPFSESLEVMEAIYNYWSAASQRKIHLPSID